MSFQAIPSQPIQPGDTVTFTQSYIVRESVRGEHLTTARGKVIALHRIADGTVLADVNWNKTGLSKRIYVKDLVKVQNGG